MTYYDQTFEPWKSVDGKCVVADETEWKRINRINRSAYSDYLGWVEIGGERPPRPIVKVPTDIFEDVTLCPVDSRGTPIGIADWLGDNGFGRAINHVDLITRFFQTIDSTPHVDYLLMTKRPELVAEKIIDLAPSMWSGPKNVILAVPIETQADIERLVPELLKCHDLCKGLAVICNPREELGFREVKLIPGDERFNVIKGIMIDSCGGIHPMDRSLNLIIVEGKEHPIHPDWLRSLRDQCLDVVPFHFAGWGRWYPSTNFDPELFHDKRIDRNGRDVTDSPGLWDETNAFLDGDDQPCNRLLDGQEHNGRLT